MSLPTGIITHVQRVKKLYKNSLRNLESFYHRKDVFRYEAVLMRQRFEENRCVQDMSIAKDLVLKGEEELFEKQSPLPMKFTHSPGGSAYQREVLPPDWVIDYWHPLEKAAYPQYFARREQRKKEYVKWWSEKYLNKD